MNARAAYTLQDLASNFRVPTSNSLCCANNRWLFLFRICFGLTGMSERAALIGGKLGRESALGKGTTVLVHVPLRAEVPESGLGTDS